jgi:3-deoxy-D-manno-octulosonate 8-phosphate phosphatase KdsC-like HAD superfamily phosphatase
LKITGIWNCAVNLVEKYYQTGVSLTQKAMAQLIFCNGLKRITELMCLDARDFLVIGDSPNDIEMIKTAGFGMAVENAHPDLKKAAGMVTKGKHGAGVEEVLGELRRRGEIR